MTVQGQKNHYNVKLLRGYGVSINLKRNRLCLKGGRDPFTGKQETEEWFVSKIPYERIVISGKGYLSTEAVKLLTDHNINLVGDIIAKESELDWEGDREEMYEPESDL